VGEWNGERMNGLLRRQFQLVFPESLRRLSHFPLPNKATPSDVFMDEKNESGLDIDFCHENFSPFTSHHSQTTSQNGPDTRATNFTFSFNFSFLARRKKPKPILLLDCYFDSLCTKSFSFSNHKLQPHSILRSDFLFHDGLIQMEMMMMKKRAIITAMSAMFR
jgi:hypothetical protein